VLGGYNNVLGLTAAPAPEASRGQVGSARRDLRQREYPQPQPH
jgi:hypothetical protein